MEKKNDSIDQDAINAELFGNDVRVDYVLESNDVNNFKANLENMIKNAQTIEDLNAIGLKLNYAIDNKLDVKIIDYQFMASSKMREIYNKLELKI